MSIPFSAHTHTQAKIQTGMPAAAHLPAGIPGVQAQGCEDGEKVPDLAGMGWSAQSSEKSLERPAGVGEADRGEWRPQEPPGRAGEQLMGPAGHPRLCPGLVFRQRTA